ncbi:MAG: hypothetical protein A2033_01080 [Bacteroidetes bacterium GWA2_31_9]|nr:MAG: hypothetical protein A2033_01080 [Bacteroidetes bacterium GWA2_31_9]
MELSKKGKKIARQIIEKGLQAEFANGLNSFDKIITDWKNNLNDNKTTYHNLYEKLMNFDKHIAGRYDGMTGSSYIFIIASQLHDGIISENDLFDFPDEIKQAIKMIANINS